MDISKSAGVIFLAAVVVLALGGRMHAGSAVSSADSATASLPKDVYPETGNRLPPPKRGDMDDYGKKVFDELTGPRISWTCLLYTSPPNDKGLSVGSAPQK